MSSTTLHVDATAAIDLLLASTEPAVGIGLQREDGCWHPGRSWWRPPGGSGSNVEVVDWGRRGPSQMITLNVLRVLAARAALRSS